MKNTSLLLLLFSLISGLNTFAQTKKPDVRGHYNLHLKSDIYQLDNPDSTASSMNRWFLDHKKLDSIRVYFSEDGTFAYRLKISIIIDTSMVQFIVPCDYSSTKGIADQIIKSFSARQISGITDLNFSFTLKYDKSKAIGNYSLIHYPDHEGYSIKYRFFSSDNGITWGIMRELELEE